MSEHRHALPDVEPGAGIIHVPEQYLAGDAASPARTLVDIVRTNAAMYPDAAAIDDGEILTYSELVASVEAWAAELRNNGVRRGDRIGIRMTSGKRELYLAILATLFAGAAYVPVDADDPDERADMVFGEADIDGVFTDEGFRMLRSRTGAESADALAGEPTVEDDAWIIFTSGSTGKPKGVAVTHRSAAAFVDAEARIFLADNPLGPDDRVLAGLSVAFDASCEEMWLAWGHGACLVPAPRSLVRSGMDLGPWLIRRDITVVSTVPTLAGLWPAEALDHVRLLIVGGEACSQELVDRLATEDREMWNTYGPTEATVVACAAQLYPGQPVSIGLPLAGWDLAVVDADGFPVKVGEVGELVIAGVGMARYLDPEKDAEKYAPLPSMGWERAYRSGDHVRLEEDGLYFVGRVDDQVKIGGRRIELGEVEANVAALPNVYNSAVAIQTTTGGEKVLVGYVSLDDAAQGFDHESARARLAETIPAALVPRLCVMDELPIRTSGKVDKKALPWPLPGVGVEAVGLTPTEQWLAELWVEVLGVSVEDNNADFFSLGGTSLAAATLVGRIRERYPTLSVRDLYDHPRLGSLAELLAGAQEAAPVAEPRVVKPVTGGVRLAQALIQVPTMTLAAAPWLSWLLLGSNVAHHFDVLPWAVFTPWWIVLALLVVFATPLGRIPLGALGARLLTAGIRPGDYPRGGAVHLRIWAAERWADASGSRSIAGSTWVNNYARMLGAQMGRGIDLHTLPPVTGLLTIGDHAAIEPEVDLSGYWLDGDILRVGAIEVGPDARVGARSTLLPGTVIGADAHVEAGSTVIADKKIKDGQRWAGSPAAKVGRSKHRFPDEHPPRRSRWVPIYGATSFMLALQPLVALVAGAAVDLWLVQLTGGQPFVGAILFAPVGALVAFAFYMAQTWVGVRLLQLGLKPGVAPVRSAQGWRAWAIGRLMDDARTYLFPLYASQLTPVWLRSLGAQIGKDAEVSTAVMIPKLTDIKEGAFLADDTMVGGYELGGGWLLTGETKVGRRSFMGNSGITGPGRRLKKNSLVAVLSSTPKKSKPGSNWWGSPPERMRRVKATLDDAAVAQESLTYRPGWGVKIARGFVETLRLLAPMTSAMLLALTLGTMLYMVERWGVAVAWAGSGLLLMAVGALAMAITVAVKWVCVGKHRAAEHPLWSSFVWLNELQDAFVESVAAPWFFVHNYGTGSINMGLRALGVRIGRGAWIDTYWFPETDLCLVGDGASVGPGTVVQTHLFQDRIMSLDTVTIGAGATLASHSVALPASVLGSGVTVGPGSLVMRGDRVPAHSVWQGNPIEPWG